MTGKISRLGPLKYSPKGIPVLEVTVAVPQRFLEVDSMGHLEAVLVGDLAETLRPRLKIGQRVCLTGSLWERTFRNRQGNRTQEFRIVVETWEPVAK